jgi:hypothetical protein
MFRDVQNDTLRTKYFVNGGVTQAKSRDFEYFAYLAQFICKEGDEEDKLALLFDLFSGFKLKITRTALKDFCEVFDQNINIFGSAHTISKADFLD